MFQFTRTRSGSSSRQAAGRDSAIAALLDAAEDMLADRGPDATMAAIARRAASLLHALRLLDRDALLACCSPPPRKRVPALVEAAHDVEHCRSSAGCRRTSGPTPRIFERQRRFIQVVVAIDEIDLRIKERRRPCSRR